MNIANITKLFKESYKNYHFIVYPLINVIDNVNCIGTYDITFKKYQKIQNYFNKNVANIKKINQKIYQHNDMELINTENISDGENINKYISKKYFYQNIIDNLMINIINIKNIDSTCFPILNKYQNEIIRDVQEYTLNYIKLYLVSECNKYYFYFSFVYCNEKEIVINKDLEKICDFINSL